jgi:2-isopropylmalate synthase
MKHVLIYDTTLRDGAQTEGVTFSLEDKLLVAERLDDLGVNYIEGGFPMSNPKDQAFFEAMAAKPPARARVVAFGTTCHATVTAKDDPGLQALLATEAPACAVVGKSWDFHVTGALQTTLDENLRMIGESVAFLKSHDREVLFDAEHFFDGLMTNGDYALACLRVAHEAGADWLVLCDTNGGRLPEEISEAVRQAASALPSSRLAIHSHNDCGVAVANTIAAVDAGCDQIQGTLNGLGERCGNADLCIAIPALQLKRGYELLSDEKLQHLTEVSRFAYEVLNMNLVATQPFMGTSAFAHKGGLHASAVARDTRSYEHIDPARVGNTRKILISELAGASNVVAKARKFNVHEDRALMARLRDKVQALENDGWQYELAEASFEMLLRREIGQTETFFELDNYHVSIRRDNDGVPITEGTVKVHVGSDALHHVAEGDGPVNALDAALRKALLTYYPNLKEMSLTDYKVRVINSQAATAARVRVIIESKDADEHWGTVGVSENIIDASWMALVDSIEYKLLKDKELAAESNDDRDNA